MGPSLTESLDGLNMHMAGVQAPLKEVPRFTGNARLRRHSQSLPSLELQHDNTKNPFFENLYRKPCSEEETIEEGKSLLSNFIADEIKNDVSTPESLRQELATCTPQGYANPQWRRVGQELRRCADDFMMSKEREHVKQKANKISELGHITFEQFKEMLSQLLTDGITKERIVVLFFFCADVAIASLKEGDETNTSLCRRFIEWSLSFVAEQVCSWVQRHGGWGAVFDSFYQNMKKAALIVGVGVVCYVGYKKLVK